MTASKLGATVGVSESTVVRFATEIGYSGYPALQQAMQEMIRSKMTSVQRLEMTSSNVPQEKLLDVVLDQDIDILKRTKESVDREAFYQAAEALVNARKVYVLGGGELVGPGHLSGPLPAAHLRHGAPGRGHQRVHHPPADGAGRGGGRHHRHQLPPVLEESGKDPEIRLRPGHGHHRHHRQPLSPSPLAEHASHVLLARSDMVSFVDSLVGPLSVINALIVTVAIRKKAEVARTLQQIETIWDEYGVYEKVDEKNS